MEEKQNFIRRIVLWWKSLFSKGSSASWDELENVNVEGREP